MDHDQICQNLQLIKTRLEAAIQEQREGLRKAALEMQKALEKMRNDRRNHPDRGCGVHPR